MVAVNGLRRIVIEPVTRVEGHGKVSILLDEQNRVKQARLHIVEFRGFERFIQGRLFWEIPVIVQRLCGICPVSHHLAGAKAMDMVVGADAGNDVHRLGGRQVVAHRADAAEPLDEDRRLPVGAALDEPLETAELDDVEPRAGDLALVVELDGDLPVALDSGDGLYGDLSSHDAVLQSNLKIS